MILFKIFYMYNLEYETFTLLANRQVGSSMENDGET